FKESVVQVWPGPGRLSSHNAHGSTNESLAASQPGRPFEFPDGYNQLFGAERYRAVEGLFDAKMALADASNPAPPAGQTLPALIQSSLSQVDVDIRPHLLSNVVVTGGSSLLYGFTDRLNHELMALYPGPRVRITAPGNTVERRFASWIGGSILASLGTFHQVRLLPVMFLSMLWDDLLILRLDVDLEKRVRRTWGWHCREEVQVTLWVPLDVRGGGRPVGDTIFHAGVLRVLGMQLLVHPLDFDTKSFKSVRRR
ncbi:MAG: hypothetical protein LQ347_003732, partial [Umbilicaria vellea]